MTREEVLLEKRSDVLEEFDKRVDPQHGVMTLAETRWYTAELLADEIVRLRSILATLREPSEAVWEAAVEAFEASSGSTFAALCAAVEVAEQEVRGER